MTETDFFPGSESYFKEIIKQKPTDTELKRLLDWKMEYETIEAFQSPEKEAVLKTSRKFLSEVYEAGIDSCRSPFSIQTVFSAIPQSNWQWLTKTDLLGRTPLVEIARKYREEQALKNGTNFDPANPSAEDMKIIRESLQFGFEPMTVAFLTGYSRGKIREIKSQLPPLDEKEKYILRLKYHHNMSGLLSYSIFGLMPFTFPQKAENYLKRVFMRQFFSLEQYAENFEQVLGRITYNCLALGTWVIGENEPLKEKTLNPDFLPEPFKKVPLKQYLKRQQDEIEGKYPQKSMADYGGTIALQEWTIDLMNLFLRNEGGYYAVSLTPYRDSSEKGKRGADIALCKNGIAVAFMDITSKSSQSAGKINNPSGIQDGLPVIVFSVAGLKRPYLDKTNEKIKYMPHTVRMKFNRDMVRKGEPFPAFEGVPENVVSEFRGQFATRMQEPTDRLAKDLGEDKLLGTPLGSNMNELRGFISRIRGVGPGLAN